ncbi:MAG: hypothetical protein MUF18_09660 [Fimbriiglobus sp.]|nr:hypothetical protein [Fimbriiglobus sp.]
MTEAEWNVSPEPFLMLYRQRGKWRTHRKLRLLACACCRRVWDKFTGFGRHGVAVAERYADGEVNGVALARARPACSSTTGTPDNAAHFVCVPNRDLPTCVNDVFRNAARVARDPTHCNDAAELAVQAQLVREVFGSLRFRPVMIQPTWRTETVVALATGIYAESAFDRMPILADALEDAGCDHADILSHCRGDGPHVRGCWVVDLLLGKE